MKVLKAINNNVVSCLDNHGEELVVMGRGLGFHAVPGSDLNESLVEKVFRMDSAEDFLRLKDLFSRLPPELLELCSSIIDYANQFLGRRLNESIYLTLTDHIQFAIDRTKQGLFIRNALATEVRVFYPEEFAIGKYALEQISAEMNVHLPEDEAASVALHIVNAEYDHTMSVTMRATQVLQPITKILENWDGLNLDKSSLLYDELIVHLKFMAMQAFTAKQSKWLDSSFAEVTKNSIPIAYGCAQAITTYLSEQSENSVSTLEQAYLAICIHRACAW